MTNIEKYKKDYEILVSLGKSLLESFLHHCYGTEFSDAVLEKRFRGDADAFAKHLETLPNFKKRYQEWYSEALALIRQLLPDRLDDFIRHYEKPKGRKDNINFESYRIEDALQNLETRRNGQLIADNKAAISHIEQQIAILESVGRRFESTLFDIRQLVQADLLDSELDVAKELLINKYSRAAGAVAGVVLEKHLLEVCTNRAIKVTKQHPTIADLNDLLKHNAVIDTAQWRFHQHLGDLRNLCAHNKQPEPTADQVTDLIQGVTKVIKTVF